MKNLFSLIWDMIMSFVGVISIIALSYISILIENPTNSEIIDAVFFGTMAIIWYLNTLLKNKSNG